MKILWLEKMTKEGSISNAARSAIYADCMSLVKEGEPKDVADSFKEMMSSPAVIGTIAIGGVGAVVGSISNAISSFRRDREFRKGITASRSDIMSHPDFSNHKEKAQARFDELIKFAPSVAMNKDLAFRILKEKVHSGFTSEDVQRLSHIQAAYTPDMKHQMHLSSRAKTASQRRTGETIASTIVMCKEAGLSSATMRRALEHTLLISSIPAIGSLTTGIVNHFHNKNEKKKMEAALTSSFEAALKHSPHDGGLNEDREKSRQIFQILAHFAPHVATQPEAARSFMHKMMTYDGTGRGTIQVEDIKNLSDIQRNHDGRQGGGSAFFTGVSAGADAMGLTKALGSGVNGINRALNTELSMMAAEDLDLKPANLRDHK